MECSARKEEDIRFLAIQDCEHKKPKRADEQNFRRTKPHTEKELVKVFVAFQRMMLTII